MSKLEALISQNAKAIAGFVGAAVMYFVTAKGLHLPILTESGITAAVTAIIVYLVPNKPA